MRRQIRTVITTLTELILLNGCTSLQNIDTTLRDFPTPKKIQPKTPYFFSDSEARIIDKKIFARYATFETARKAYVENKSIQTWQVLDTTANQIIEDLGVLLVDLKTNTEMVASQLRAARINGHTNLTKGYALQIEKIGSRYQTIFHLEHDIYQTVYRLWFEIERPKALKTKKE